MYRTLIVLFILCGLMTWKVQAAQVVEGPAGGKPMFAKTGPKGETHLIFDKDGEVFYASSTDSGGTWSTPLPVINTASKTPGLEFDAWDLAVGSDGKVHVALGNNAWKLKLPKDQWGFFYASLAPGEKVFSPLRNLNHLPSEGFSLAAGPNGRIGAFYLAGKVFGMLSSDNGGTFSAPGEVNPALNPCECCETRVAAGPNGSMAIFYRDKTGGNRDLYFANLSSGGQSTREKVSVTGWPINACPMTYYSIVPSKSGYVVAWPTKETVFFGRLDPQGKLLPPGEVKTPGTHGMRTGLLALEAPNGHVLVGWNNNSMLGWQEYDEKSLGLGLPGSAKTTGTGMAAFVDARGNFVIVK